MTHHSRRAFVAAVCIATVLRTAPTGAQAPAPSDALDAVVQVYRATFGTTPLRVQFALAPDGTIAGLGISPDD